MLPKIIVILGPTASGKTDLGLQLAKKFNGEIVSADSRQVYKKMNIGTAKPSGKWKPAVIPSPVIRRGKLREGSLSRLSFPRKRESRQSAMDSRFRGNDKMMYVVEGIPHHLMDTVDPDESFGLADYKALAVKHIKDVLKRNKLPIVVGGTGLYIWTLVDNLDIPKVEPNPQLRQQLEKKPLPELITLLKKIDPDTAKKIDLQNPRRVLRALEVFIMSGESFFTQRTKSKPLFAALAIGIDLPREELFARINTRVDKQIEEGLVAETKKLMKKKYGWELPSMSGIGYRQIGFYLRGEATLREAIDILKRDTRRYAKRQMTWFRKDKRIKWLNGPDYHRRERGATSRRHKSAEGLVKEFLS